jgi:hypothetical protein
MDQLPLPEGTTEAQWMAAAKDVIESYGGDARKVVAMMMISHEVQQSQIAYLQDQLEQIAAAVPGLVKIDYGDTRLSPIHCEMS